MRIWDRIPEQGSAIVILIVYIVLKLLGVLDWSWWWVLSPVWIPAVFVVIGVWILSKRGW